MGMRVDGGASSAAMASWQAQQPTAAAAPAAPQQAAVSAQSQLDSALHALAQGSNVSKMA